jgi:hypothetical protein
MRLEELLTHFFCFSENAYLPAATAAQPWMRVLPTWMFIGAQDAGAHAADKMGMKKK